MATVGNNFSQKVQNLRNAFFGLEKNDGEVCLNGSKVRGNGEVALVKRLLKNDKLRHYYYELCDKNAEYLYKKALKHIENIEFHMNSFEQAEKEEAKLALTLAALIDAYPELILEKGFEEDDYFQL